MKGCLAAESSVWCSRRPPICITQIEAELSEEQYMANVVLAVSGGQNEPRDVLSGTAWALLNNPDQLAKIKSEQYGWSDGCEEYLRYMAPISLVARQIAKPLEIHGHQFNVGDFIVLFIASGNRDESYFENPINSISRVKAKSTIHLFLGHTFVSVPLSEDL